jgi:hypothetical protein
MTKTMVPDLLAKNASWKSTSHPHFFPIALEKPAYTPNIDHTVYPNLHPIPDRAAMNATLASISPPQNPFPLIPLRALLITTKRRTITTIMC